MVDLMFSLQHGNFFTLERFVKSCTSIVVFYLLVAIEASYFLVIMTDLSKSLSLHSTVYI